MLVLLFKDVMQDKGVFSVFRSIFSLLLSYGFLLLANGLFNSLLGLRATLEGVNYQLARIYHGQLFFRPLVGGSVRGAHYRQGGPYPGFCSVCIADVCDGFVTSICF